MSRPSPRLPYPSRARPRPTTDPSNYVSPPLPPHLALPPSPPAPPLPSITRGPYLPASPHSPPSSSSTHSLPSSSTPPVIVDHSPANDGTLTRSARKLHAEASLLLHLASSTPSPDGGAVKELPCPPLPAPGPRRAGPGRAQDEPAGNSLGIVVGVGVDVGGPECKSKIRTVVPPTPPSSRCASPALERTESAEVSFIPSLRDAAALCRAKASEVVDAPPPAPSNGVVPGDTVGRPPSSSSSSSARKSKRIGKSFSLGAGEKKGRRRSTSKSPKETIGRAIASSTPASKTKKQGPKKRRPGYVRPIILRRQRVSDRLLDLLRTAPRPANPSTLDPARARSFPYVDLDRRLAKFYGLRLVWPPKAPFTRRGLRSARRMKVDELERLEATLDSGGVRLELAEWVLEDEPHRAQEHVSASSLASDTVNVQPTPTPADRSRLSTPSHLSPAAAHALPLPSPRPRGTLHPLSSSAPASTLTLRPRWRASSGSDSPAPSSPFAWSEFLRSDSEPLFLRGDGDEDEEEGDEEWLPSGGAAKRRRTSSGLVGC